MKYWLNRFAMVLHVLKTRESFDQGLVGCFEPMQNLWSMLNVSRNHPQAFNSLGMGYLFFISLYPLVASLLDVGNGACFLEHTIVSHKTMVPM